MTLVPGRPCILPPLIFEQIGVPARGKVLGAM